jgi:DUF4097 and DUF4098 domain-containing protein YvlB
MKSRVLTISILIAVAILGPALVTRAAQTAEQPLYDQKPKPDPKPQTHRPEKHDPASDPQAEPATFKLDRGGKISVSLASGNIKITGWDRDVIEAKANDEDAEQSLRVRFDGDARNARITVVRASDLRRHDGTVLLTVKAPRYADIELAETHHGDLEVSDLDGAASLITSNGDITASRVGSLNVMTRNGDITTRDINGVYTVRSFNGDIDALNVKGRAEITATSGDVRIQNAGNDVKAVSASGDIEVTCAKGTVDAGTASGSVTLIGIIGDAVGETASGDVIFKGPIRPDGRYKLKSLSGVVEMLIQSDAPGFTATLSSYSGEIETQFELKLRGPLSGAINQRITGVYGDGRAQIAMDSFSGTVRIVKAPQGSIRQCK